MPLVASAIDTLKAENSALRTELDNLLDSDIGEVMARNQELFAENQRLRAELERRK